MFQSGDVIQITERLHEMVQAVEKCASSLRAVQPMSGDHCLLNHVHQEQLSDEKLLELLHNTFVQFLTSSRAVYP